MEDGQDRSIGHGCVQRPHASMCMCEWQYGYIGACMGMRVYVYV